MTSEDIDYRNGYCHAFALAAAEITGRPMYALREKDGRSWLTAHVFVQIDDDHGLDVRGISSVSSILQNYGCWGYDDVPWSLECWDEDDIRRAIRRGDLKPLPRHIRQAAAVAARAVLEGEALS